MTGEITTTLRWRNPYGRPYDGDLFVGNICIGQIMPRDGQWLTWLMTSEIGYSCGLHPTKAAARSALELAAREALRG